MIGAAVAVVRAPRPATVTRRLLLIWRRHGLLRLVARRLVAMLIVTFGITLVAFVLTHIVPSDPVAANLGLHAISDPNVVRAYKQEYGLDKPLLVQYEIYLGHLAHGDLGVSQQTRRHVATDLRQFVPASFELGLFALIIALLIGVPLGLLAATRRDSLIDQALGLVSQSGISMPPFWIGLIALYLFSFSVQLAPGSGRLSPGAIPPPLVTGMYTVDALLTGDLSTFGDALHHLVLPAIVLAIPGTAILLRFTRAAVLEVIHSDFVTAARAKGLPRLRVLVRYTFRAALAPVLTVTGLMFADFITGAVLVENVFGYQGVGLYAARSALNLDLTAITGISIFVAIVYIVTNFAIDVLHGVADPRVGIS